MMGARDESYRNGPVQRDRSLTTDSLFGDRKQERDMVTGTSGEFAWQGSEKSAMDKRTRREATPRQPGLDGRL